MPSRFPPNPVRWDFTYTADEHWSWRRVSADATAVPCTDRHKNFGSAVHDAMSHGFSPAKHAWIVEDKSSVTYFEPGETPRVLPKSSPEAPAS